MKKVGLSHDEERVWGGYPSRGQDKAYAMVKFSCKTKKLP